MAMKEIVVRLLYKQLQEWIDTYIRVRNRYVQQGYRERAKTCGKGVAFNGYSVITGIDNAELGDNVHIGEKAFIRAEGGLFIGSHTHLARRCTIYTHNHNYKGKRIPYDETFTCKPVVIGEAVWIGINVTILPGTKIGNGAIIGAGCVIKGEVPEYAIVVKNDATSILSYRDDTHYQRCYTNKEFGGVNGHSIGGSN